jgi:hypothetical protein
LGQNRIITGLQHAGSRVHAGKFVCAGAAFGYAWDKADIAKDKTGIMEAIVLQDKVVKYTSFVRRKAMEIKSTKLLRLYFAA